MSGVQIAFVSRHGVRARMAAALFNSMADRAKARSRAYALEGVEPVPPLVDQLMEEMDVNASAEDVAPLTLPVTASIVMLGAVVVEAPKGILTNWPSLELDGTVEGARAVRDDLSSCIVMWVAREGWVDSTERHLRR